MVDLDKLIADLPLTPDMAERDGNVYNAIVIPDHENHRVGKDSRGLPLILLTIDPDTRITPSPPIKLENLQVLHNAYCRILLPDGRLEQGQFTVLQCISYESSLQVYFLKVVSALLLSLPKSPQQEQIQIAVENLIRLFRAMQQPARKTLQGLWAEVYLISRVRNPISLVRAWHALPNETHDFGSDEILIEVKSSSTRSRNHHFSLNQLLPHEGTKLIVASVFVERASSGKSIEKLSTKIRKKLSKEPQLLIHYDQVLALTLGDSWKDSIDVRFNTKLAKQSLEFYDSATIPTVPLPLPKGVSNVRFISSLSESKPIERSQLKVQNDLLRTFL